MRILLVEDDAALGPELKASLAKHGYAVDLAVNGIDGETLGREDIYDLVVLDLGLPDRSGLDVLRHWRAQKNNIPVLVLTARSAWQERVDGFDAGADDYLPKPFHTEELLARMTALLRRANQQITSQLQTSGLTLDENTQSVIREGTEVALTGTEYRLLRYMMHNPGRVLSKLQLVEHMYDDCAENDSNVVEAYIKMLRKKIGHEMISTKRGQGYVFGASR
ncbi:DNA-binding response regulator, OmpR family, contains REC and winged-helix (wHTH) domain [Amphritea atlantica]|jgi:DNA-binding response OmpR family regulator|uniref:DNA-binding response regulator, OmpR family, contains REC and winged-helix (WHTH) domain n=1 Tax=Amphritea atlantica TaxID=355243 RepID=A0A1H9EVL3_9GAMM|nr:response regulator transcription factor [Amphritea atlantica]SEQ29283.1 DNA-binding response regulator, OmpR family, contains REC and winged-helix (wHTH) domain [Amphritea atlantica]